MRRRVLAIAVVALVLGSVQTGFAQGYDPNTDPSLVGWWTFDETSGNVAGDASGNGNDGTLVGDPQWVPGRVGGALEFNGDDYVNCGNDPSLTIRDEITIAFWFQVEAFQTTWEAFLAKGDNSYRASRGGGDGNGTHLGLSGTSTGGGDGYFNAPTIITGGDWHHYAGVYDGAEGRIYIDGVLDVTSPGTGQINESTYEFWIGTNSQNTDRLLHGLLDDVRLYSRALTLAEIKTLMPPQFKAHDPDPADGARGIVTPLFKWDAGDTALFHKVYFGTNPDLTEADVKSAQQPFNLYYHMLPLEPGVTYYWRVDEIEANGTVHIGDVWSASTTPLISHLPQPADGDGAVSPEATLSWTGGMNALTYHLYLGEDLDAVTQGTADVDMGILAESAFDPEGLKGGTTYYWRADGVAFDDTVTTGEIWSFSTFLLVDNFEGYDDDMDAGTAVFQTWADGIDNGTGSIVGHLESQNGTFNETTIVHGGGQSMLLDFDNSISPWYSESQRSWATSQDWTINGLSDLVLWVRGYPGPAEYTEDAGVYSIAGEGTDIWGTADQFTYVHKQLSGNGSLVARVVSNGTGSNTWAKGGVMIRQSLDAGSIHSFMPITGGGGNGASFQYRPIADSDSFNSDVTDAVVPPYWVKLERSGSSLTGSISPDGSAWTQLGDPQFIIMNDPVYIGLAVTSHAAGELRTFEFDNVQQSGGVSGAWQMTEIGLTRNAGVPLYVALEDSTGKIGVVSDPNLVNAGEWTEWNIALADFGVDASRVRAMYLGAGDRDNPVPDGSGRVFIDDIRVIKPAPAVEEPAEVVVE